MVSQSNDGFQEYGFSVILWFPLNESHISLILDYQFCACVMRTSGVPQLQVISIERLYGYK